MLTSSVSSHRPSGNHYSCGGRQLNSLGRANQHNGLIRKSTLTLTAPPSAFSGDWSRKCPVDFMESPSMSHKHTRGEPPSSYRGFATRRAFIHVRIMFPFLTSTYPKGVRYPPKEYDTPHKRSQKSTIPLKEDYTAPQKYYKS